MAALLVREGFITVEDLYLHVSLFCQQSVIPTNMLSNMSLDYAD